MDPSICEITNYQHLMPTEDDVVALIERCHENRIEGERFVAITEASTAPNVRQSEAPEYSDEDGDVYPVLYRVLRVDVNGLILLHAMFVDYFRGKIEQIGLEYVLIDSRTLNCSAHSVGLFADTVNFLDVEPNDLVWVFDLELAGGTLGSHFVPVETPDGVIFPVRCAKWFAKTICFVDREFNPTDSVKCTDELFHTVTKVARNQPEVVEGLAEWGFEEYNEGPLPIQIAEVKRPLADRTQPTTEGSQIQRAETSQPVRKFPQPPVMPPVEKPTEVVPEAPRDVPKVVEPREIPKTTRREEELPSQAAPASSSSIESAVPPSTSQAFTAFFENRAPTQRNEAPSKPEPSKPAASEAPRRLESERTKRSGASGSSNRSTSSSESQTVPRRETPKFDRSKLDEETESEDGSDVPVRREARKPSSVRSSRPMKAAEATKPAPGVPSTSTASRTSDASSALPKKTSSSSTFFTQQKKVVPVEDKPKRTAPVFAQVSKTPTHEPVATPQVAEPEIDADELLNRNIFALDEQGLGVEEQDRNDIIQMLPDVMKIAILKTLADAPANQFDYTCKIWKVKNKRRPPFKNVPPRSPLAINYRATADSLFKTGPLKEAYPIAYRVIAVLGKENQLILESLFPHHFLYVPEGDVYERQFLILDAESFEGPDFDRSGFNVYDSAVNDIVCVYDLVPYMGKQPDSSCFERHSYNRKEPFEITFKAFAHCFVNLSIFKTLYGMVNYDKTIITGIDEPVNVEKHKEIEISIGDALYMADMFRVDVIQHHIFTNISRFDNLRAGSMLTYATESGPQKMVIVAGKKLNNIQESYEKPFQPEIMEKHGLDEIEALDRQAAAFALGKYGEEMSGRIELLLKAYPVHLNFDARDHFCGTITFIDIAGCPSDPKLKEEPELKVYIPEVGSFGIQIYNQKRFAVMYMSKNFVSSNIAMIKRVNSSNHLLATAMDKSPNADPAIQFLCNGGFARSMKRQAQQAKETDLKDYSSYQLICDALRTGELKKDYSFEEIENLKIDPYMRFEHKPTLRLDDQQENIVKYIACMKEWPAIAVINACAGAGKSLCSVAVIKQSAKDYPNSIQLVCSAANRAVDNLAESLASLGEAEIRPIRIFSSRQRAKLNFKEPRHGFNAVVERMLEDVWQYQIEEAEQELLQSYITAYKKLGKIAANPRGRDDFDCIDEMKNTMKKLLPVVCDVVMQKYRPHVILTTIDFFISQSLSKYGNTLCRQKFTRLVVDEASQLEEARFILLLNRNFEAKQFVVVGDPNQLPPYYPSTYDQNLKGLFGMPTLTLLNKKNTGCIPMIELTYNYRMHPMLLEMTSVGFYQGKLTSMEGPWKKKAAKWRYLGDNPLRICSVDGETANDGTSMINTQEAIQATNLVIAAYNDGVEESEIGVICLYKSQQSLILTMLRKNDLCGVEVATVDSYQGREKDYIILCTTRTFFRPGDFFYDPNRANVATSRAILGMVILCHDLSVASADPWKNLVDFCKKKNLYIKNYSYNN